MRADIRLVVGRIDLSKG